MLDTTGTRSATAGVIWITGYSGAGKTTVGRKVEARLRSEGAQTVFLDGDDLRAIFAGKWGYDRQERVELAHIYFRLCSHLASQGSTVIISAIAMYDEIRKWVRANIPNSVEIFLDVPEVERRRRDAATKRIYSRIQNMGDLYDCPIDPDLTIENHGSATPDAVANQIVALYRRGAFRGDADKGRNAHWTWFYRSGNISSQPSSFAVDVAARIALPSAIVEIGCGNGRDAVYFASLGHKVCAIDMSSTAIAVCQRQHADTGILFVRGSLPETQHDLPAPFDVAYCRFVIHAMPETEEQDTLAAAAACLTRGGRLFIECRSINDPMAHIGEILSPTERIHGHYRRFIIVDDLIDQVREAGFEVLSAAESNGLAVFGDEDPVVIRLVAKKL